MNSVLESKFKNLPNNPGVYQFKNDKGKVIYVGKAINLKSRVRSYFTGVNQSAKTAALISKTYDLELIVTDNEVEALVLENNLEKDYGDMVGEVVKVLKGKTDDLIDDLNDKMKRLVELLEFEKAAELRDRMEQLKIISSKQKVVSDDFEDRDIIALTYEGKDSACSVFNVRNGKLVGKKQLRLAIEEGEELANIYSAAIKFYYTDFTDIPKEIVVEVEPTDLEILSEWLSRNANRKVRLTIPQRGNLRSLIKMCSENALLQLKEIQIQKMKNEGQVSYSVSALQRDLRLPNLPKKIECFDISNLQGTDTVASLVVFEDGKPRKSLYRKYIIKDVSGPDDFLSMQEVIRRRYTKVVQGEDKLPDLIMVDGGKGQLSSAIESIKDLGIKNFTIIGLAKRLEEVYLTGQSEPASISKTSSGLKLLQKIRDEAHRFAITFHRKRRSKRTIKTELTNIKGIGSSTAQKLLKELGSFSAIKNTDHAKLISLVGKQKANLIKKYFDENSP